MRPPVALAALAVLSLAALAAPRPASAQLCASDADAAGCPFRCIGSADLSGATPTLVGERLCQAMDGLAATAEKLGDGAGVHTEPARDEIDALVRSSFGQAVSSQAIFVYNSGLQRTDAVQALVEELLGDPVCGSESALAELQQLLAARAADVVEAALIAAPLGQAVQAAAPALPALGDAREVLQGLVTPPDAAPTVASLRMLIDEMRARMQGVVSLDVTALHAMSAEMSASVAPFLVACGGCAAAVAGPVGLLRAGQQVDPAAHLGCPPDWPAWGASCWGAFAYPMTFTAAAASSALTGPGCAQARELVASTAELLETVQALLLAGVSTGQRISQSLERAATAGESLQALADLLGSDGAESVQTVEQHLNEAIAGLNAAAAIVQGEVVPGLARLGGGALQEIGAHVVQMAHCHNRLHAVGQAVSGQVREGALELRGAGERLVSGGAVATDLVGQGEGAMDAAVGFASDEFARLAAERNRIHMELWGVPWPAIPSAAQMLGFPNVELVPTAAGPVPVPHPNLASFLADPSRLLRLLSDIAALEAATLQIVPRAVQAGLAVFIDLDGQRETARAEFDLGGAGAAAAIPLLDSPGTLGVPTLPLPDLGTFAVNARDIGPLQPLGPVQVSYAATLLAEYLLAVRHLPTRVRGSDGRPLPPGESCLSCPHELTMTDLWDSLDRAGVRESVRVQLYSGRTLVADLGTHELARGAAWASMPATRDFIPAAGSPDPAGACGYRLVVLGARGAALAETEACLARRE